MQDVNGEGKRIMEMIQNCIKNKPLSHVATKGINGDCCDFCGKPVDLWVVEERCLNRIDLGRRGNA